MVPVNRSEALASPLGSVESYAYDPTLCDLCGTCETKILIDLPPPCLTTDGRLVDQPLRKIQCTHCGMVRCGTPVSAAVLKQHYGEQYLLGIRSDSGEPLIFHDKGTQERSDALSAWITEALQHHLNVFAPQAILEVGCGDGTLLRRLAAHWPTAKVAGTDLNGRNTEIARAAGLDVRCIGVDDISDNYDLICAVAVIEHTPSPRRFVQDLARHLRPGGVLVLIQPCQDDGNRDIFFWDHLYHFHSTQIGAFAAMAGLTESYRASRHTALPGFSLSVLTWATATEPLEVRSIFAIDDKVTETARRWLDLFGSLNQWLDEMSGREIVVWGLGEAFDLLTTYSHLRRSMISHGFDDNIARASGRSWGFPIGLVALNELEPGRSALLVTFKPNHKLAALLGDLKIPKFVVMEG